MKTPSDLPAKGGGTRQDWQAASGHMAHQRLTIEGNAFARRSCSIKDLEQAHACHLRAYLKGLPLKGIDRSAAAPALSALIQQRAAPLQATGFQKHMLRKEAPRRRTPLVR